MGFGARDMLEVLEFFYDEMSEWECNFVSGCQNDHGEGKPLDEKRMDKLTEIYNAHSDESRDMTGGLYHL